MSDWTRTRLVYLDPVFTYPLYGSLCTYFSWFLLADFTHSFLPILHVCVTLLYVGLPGVNHMKLPNWPEGIPSHWAQRLEKCPALTLGKAVLPKTPTVSDLPPAPWTESSPFAVHLQQMLFLGRKQYCANLWLRNENLGPDLKSSEPQCPHLSRRDHSSFPKSSGDQAQTKCCESGWDHKPVGKGTVLLHKRKIKSWALFCDNTIWR